MLPQTNHYRADIDGLRAIAVLAVILCHAKLGHTGGFVGVDIFFVISGYLIIKRVADDHCNGLFSISEFWTKRIRRLFFPYALMLSSTFFAGYHILWPHDYNKFAMSALSTLLCVSNIYFWTDTGYFSPQADTQLLLHTWSLSIEEQFYFSLPILLFFLGKKRISIITGLTCLTLLSFILCVYCSHFHRSANYYLLPTRFWELGIGGLIGMGCVNHTNTIRKKLALPLSVIAIPLLALPIYLFDSTTIFPGVLALAPTLSTGIIIILGTNSQSSLITRVLSLSPLTFIGKISYSLYLWHWPVISLSNHLISNVTPQKNSILLPYIYLTITFTLSLLTYYLVEKPILNQTLLTTKRKLVIATAGLTLTFVGTSILCLWTSGFASRLTADVKLMQSTATRDPKWSVENVPEDITSDRLTQLGNADSTCSLLIWGDSHAMAVLPAIDKACTVNNISAVAATHSSTPPIANYFTVDEYGLNRENLLFSRKLMDYIRKKRIKFVLLISTWKTLSKDTDAYQKLTDMVTKLTAEGAKVYVMKTIPIYSFNVPKVVIARSYHQQSLQDILITETEYDHQNPFPDNGLALTDAGATILEPSTCLQSSDGNFYPFAKEGCLYYDNHHLSTLGAMKLLPLFCSITREIADANN